MKMFPYIHNIDDVLPHIKTFDEIIVAERDGFTWIDYVIDISGQTFSRKYDGWEYRRECRGLFFDKNGIIISRPFHKFFNVGQLDETQPNLINLDQPHLILTKEDGSMVRPFMVDGEIRWGTRKGESETILSLRNDFPEMFGEHGDDHPAYKKIRHMLKMNQTPIFEYVGPNNPHVLTYPEKRLILLALRDNFSGQYISVYDMDYPMFDVVEKHESPSSINELLETIRVIQGSEGVVLSFADGSYYKIKGEDYVLKHRARDEISKERIVWKAILDGTFDDILPILNDQDREKAKVMETEFWQLYKGTLDYLNNVVHDALAKYSDKKSFATDRNHGLSKTETRFVFAGFDKKSVEEVLKDHIEKFLHQDTKQKELREWMGIHSKKMVNNG